jgi:hypothetical protein
MTKLKGTPEGPNGGSRRLRGGSNKVPPKALREEGIRGLGGTFLDSSRNHLEGVQGNKTPLG